MTFYAPRGKKFSDFQIIEAHDKLHCIFIQNDKHQKQTGEHGNTYGLAVSENGYEWAYEGTIKRIGKKGSWNDSSLWAPDVFNVKGKYYMLYSAVSNSSSDPHYTQQVGLSVSDDLKNWSDVTSEPVITTTHTGKYYYPARMHKFAFRDPVVYHARGLYYCILAAKDKTKPYERSGCVALLSSKNLKNWKTLPPIFSPGRYWEIETPHLYKINDAWVLLFGEYTNGISIRYAISTSPSRKFREPQNNELTPSYCYAGRMIRWKDEFLLYHWIQDPVVGKPETYLAPPKKIIKNKNRIYLKQYNITNERIQAVKPSRLLQSVKQSKEKKAMSTFPLKTHASITSTSKPSAYDRRIFLDRTTHGLCIRDFTKDNEVNDLRTIPVKTTKNSEVKITLDGRFMEVYVDGYFAHAAILARRKQDVLSLEISSW
ncbi:MAG: family 43 glycosylhydrolase [Candidatus Woesearchaeota archaeon]